MSDILNNNNIEEENLFKKEEENLFKKMVLFAEELLRTGSEQVEYQQILENLLYISKAKYGALTVLNESNGKYTTLAVAGLNEKMKKISKILGFEIIGKEWNEYSTENNQLEGKIAVRFSSLVELAECVIPKVISHAIEKLLNIGEIAVTKIIVNNQMIGDFTLIMPAGRQFENDYLVEIYSRQIDMFVTRIKAEEKLRRSEEKYRLLIENSHDIIYILDTKGLITFASNSWASTVNYSIEETSGKPLGVFVHPDDVPMCLAFMKKIIDTKQPQTGIEYRVRHKNGAWLWHNSNVVPLFDSNNKIVGFEGCASDITERKVMERKLLMKQNMLKAIAEATNEFLVNSDVFRAISDGLILVGKATEVDRAYFFKNNFDRNNLPFSASQIIEWNSNFAEPQIDSPNLQNILSEDNKEVIEPLEKRLPYIGITRELEPSNHKKRLEEQNILSIILLPVFVADVFYGYAGFDDCKNERVWAEDEIALLMLFANSIAGAINRNNSEVRIEYLSYHDQLTGLHNRRYYEKELERLNSDEKYVPITLVMADVNGLKLTNDAFGHKAGDIILEKIADILKKVCRAEDIVARIGGDEFVLLLPETDAYNADKIINRVNAAITLEQIDNIILSISIGFATKQNASDDMNEVFKRAEDEMYKHKLYESTSMRSRTIDLIMNTLYEKNNGEMLHSKRVSEICADIATNMKFDANEISQIRIAGLMHDIGKIGIDEKILNKPQKLNRDEWDEIERHSEIGYRILSSVNEFSEIAEYVLEHHERWSGGGYPRGFKGEEISLQARIIAVADAYDAMTSDKTYGKTMSEEEAVNEMTGCSGTQFDSAVVKVFVEKVLRKVSQGTVL